MSVIQISKVQMRRGPEQDLPGKPTSLSPLTFEPGLDIGEMGFATDSGRLFIGQLPNVGQPNYARTDFPYQNIEILTESSIDVLRSMFNFLRRDEGSGAFYRATLQPTEDGVWQDVMVERAYGTAQAYHMVGNEVIATIEYYAATNDSQGVIPLRNGVLRVLSDNCSDDALLNDDALTLRRLDLSTPAALDGNDAFENVAFKVTRGGAIGEPYFRFMYTTTAMDEPVSLFFRVTRPLTDTELPFDLGPIDRSAVGLTVADVQNIVGDMVNRDTQVGIAVTFNSCSRKLDFRTQGQGGTGGSFAFDLNLTGDIVGQQHLTSDQTSFSLTTTLAPNGVAPGLYVNPTVTVDRSGRITAITAAQNVTAIDPSAVYGAQNLGTGHEVFAAVSGRDLQFRSLVAGTGVTLDETATQITITASGQQSLVAGSNITLTAGTNNTLIISATVPSSTASSSDITALQSNVSALQSTVSTLQSNASTQGSQIQALQASGNSTQAAQISALQANTAQLGGQIASLQSNGSANSQQASQISALQANTAQLGGQIVSLLANASTQGSQIAALQSGGGGGSGGGTDQTANVAALQSNVSALQSNTVTLQQEITLASGVTPGTYTNATISVDARGRVTSAVSGTAQSSNTTGGSAASLVAAGIVPITLDTSAVIKTPKIADFSFLDAGSTRTTDGPVGITYFMNTVGTNPNSQFTQYLKPMTGYSATNGMTVICGFTMTFPPMSFQGGGLAVVDANGRFVTMEIIQNHGGYSIEQNNWNNFTSYNTTNWSFSNANQSFSPRGIWWQKMQVSSAGISVFMSPDGVDYFQIVSNSNWVTNPVSAGFVLKQAQEQPAAFPSPFLKGVLFHFDIQQGLV